MRIKRLCAEFVNLRKNNALSLLTWSHVQHFCICGTEVTTLFASIVLNSKCHICLFRWNTCSVILTVLSLCCWQVKLNFHQSPCVRSLLLLLARLHPSGIRLFFFQASECIRTWACQRHPSWSRTALLTGWHSLVRFVIPLKDLWQRRLTSTKAFPEQFYPSLAIRAVYLRSARRWLSEAQRALERPPSPIRQWRVITQVVNCTQHTHARWVFLAKLDTQPLRARPLTPSHQNRRFSF